jgi:hypothetical protein
MYLQELLSKKPYKNLFYDDNSKATDGKSRIRILNLLNGSKDSDPSKNFTLITSDPWIHNPEFWIRIRKANLLRIRLDPEL